LLSGTDGAAATAQTTRQALEVLLADAPAIAALLPPGYLATVERYVALLLVAAALTGHEDIAPAVAIILGGGLAYAWKKGVLSWR